MKKVFSIFLLLIISSIVYRNWFTFKLFFYGDYVYYTRDTLLSFFPFSVWTGNFGLGGFDVVFWRLPQYVIYYLGAQNGFELNQIDRFIVLWPWVVLSSVSIYLLLSLWNLSEKSKIIGALIFAFNTYFLSISTQGHLLISVASCLSILTLYAYIKSLREDKIRYVPLVGILLALTTNFDLRLWYITSLLIFLYFVFDSWVNKYSFKRITARASRLLAIYVLYFLLNLFWVLPTLASAGAVGGSVLSRTLFGNEFLNINYSYSLFHPFWTGAQPAWFKVQDIFWVSWILPIFALLGFVIGRKNKLIVFFGVLAVIGVFLTKQTSIPFSDAYEWLFKNFPGFSAFREASKFYYLVALSYAVLISYFINFLDIKKNSRSKYAKWGVITIILFLLAWNAKPVITGEIGSLFVERQISEDYPKFYKFVKAQNEYFRVAWFPRPTKWHNATWQNPQLNLLDTINSDWVEFRPKETVEKYSSGDAEEADIGIDFLKSDMGQSILSSSSVKYLVLPISDPANSDDVYAFSGRTDKEVYSEIKKIKSLREIELGMEKLKVFEVDTFKPHFYIANQSNSLGKNLSYKEIKGLRISGAHYEVVFDNVKEPIYLVFSERFSPRWRFIIGEKSFFDIMRIGKLTGISSISNDLNLNTFYVDPQRFCKNSSNECQKLNDGSYKFKAHIYYSPQTYYGIGLIISITVWVLMSGLLVITVVKRR